MSTPDDFRLDCKLDSLEKFAKFSQFADKSKRKAGGNGDLTGSGA